MFERSRRGEKALLVQPRRHGVDFDAAASEFRELARSAGAEVVAELVARVDRPHPALYVGTGKAEEAKLLVQTSGADLVLVNHQLTPIQERNLEKLLECRVVDRAGLILDIFAQRARSHEGKLQVELAQLQHMATRLVRGWTHLERQRGGAIGLRGPGETQLETDRRLLAERVKILKARLEIAVRQREQGRKSREKSALPAIALVGYTNAGKSTLFNALARSSVYTADQLFATLDPTVRRVGGFAFGAVTLADTVGFVSELPHELVAAFKSTLTEAREADLLLHVIDGADPLMPERIAEVEAVLTEIGAGELPQIQVVNKIDLTGAQPAVEAQDGRIRARAYLSAVTGAGLDGLRAAIETEFGAERVHRQLRLGYADAGLRARLIALGAVRAEADLAGEGWQVEVDLPRRLALQLAALPGAQGELVRSQLLAEVTHEQREHAR
ncbi:MAG: GTPase HflX [Xanthomonadales bacterium]|nr:GTPase HflX [Xanthomonadales bacterium]MCC6591905.1 GTPase HflX [Xanthomonadales bacterium]MCE7930047.1 GTPase HflX [Xanthomonadales bacterium PRO6]